MATHTAAIRRDLADLAKRSNPRRLIDEVAEALPDIEKALAAGASYAEICETFVANGVPLTVVSLSTYLYRLRKAAKLESTSAVGTPPAKRSATKTKIGAAAGKATARKARP